MKKEIKKGDEMKKEMECGMLQIEETCISLPALFAVMSRVLQEKGSVFLRSFYKVEREESEYAVSNIG